LETTQNTKPIDLIIDDKMSIRLGQSCIGKTDEKKYCDNCKLKFRCFTNDTLKIHATNDINVNVKTMVLDFQINVFLISNCPELREVIEV